MAPVTRRSFLAAASAFTLGSLESAAATKPDFTWLASGLLFSFGSYKQELRQKYILPAGIAESAWARLSPEIGHNDTLADTSAGDFDSLTVETALHCTGEDSVEHHGMKFTGGEPGLRLIYAGHEENQTSKGRSLVVTHRDPALQLQVKSFYEAWDGIPVVHRHTEVTNEGGSSVGIEYLSSAMLANFASAAGFEQELLIHLCFNSWQAEGQWRTLKPSQLGLVPNSEFSVSAAFASSLGTWSTERYLPMCIIENVPLGISWFWQIEYNGSWHWEISQTSARALYAYIGGPDEQHAHAWKSLAPGQTYRTVSVALGCVRGGFEQAVAALTHYRRDICAQAGQIRNRSCPVIFNDAISLNLDPTTQKELPLIDAAAELGSEYYVIDAGWYAAIHENWWGTVGAWQAPQTRWPGGLGAVFSHIRTRGMLPGLWLEPEVVGIHSPLAQKPDDWFFMRHGRRVIDHSRYLLDFRNPEVRKWLDSVIARIVNDWGIEYIKLDYNVDGLEGTDLHADSPGQGMHEHNLALLDWLDSILSRYPRLIIENCASGGGRLDYAMLSRLQLESATDQDDYRNYPSIVAGLTAGVLPEQLGVWSFPAADATPDQASFHMVNAMLGRIHQSGAADRWPGEVRAQVQTGIRVYKETIRGHLTSSVPFYPFGMPDMTNKTAPVALGIRSAEAHLCRSLETGRPGERNHPRRFIPFALSGGSRHSRRKPKRALHHYVPARVHGLHPGRLRPRENAESVHEIIAFCSCACRLLANCPN